MNTRNKVLYFLMGAIFAGSMGWGLSRPVEAIAPSQVERKVNVLSQREVTRMEKDIAALERSIQEDHDFLTTKFSAGAGKGGWSAQYAQKKHDIDQNLPGKERRLEDLRAQLKTLRM